MTPLNLALVLVGYGHVARRFVDLVDESEEALAALGIRARVVGACTRRRGGVFDDKGLANAEIERVLAKVKEPLLTGFECFDVFRDESGQKLAADRKSIAYRLHYRAADKTLKTEEIDTAHKAVVAALTGGLPVTQR